MHQSRGEDGSRRLDPIYWSSSLQDFDDPKPCTVAKISLVRQGSLNGVYLLQLLYAYFTQHTLVNKYYENKDTLRPKTSKTYLKRLPCS